MAETILGPIIDEAVSKAISIATEQICLVWGFEKELNSLKELLEMIQYVLQDAEDKQEGDPNVRCWLQNLKDVAYDAVDALDEYAYYLLQLKVETQGQKKKQVCLFFFRSNPIMFRLKMGNKIKKINESLAKIKGDVVFPLLSRGGVALHVSQNPKTDSFLDSTPIGRSDDVSEIISQLSKLRSQHSISVVSIVGMAGIGKTTLAKSVYKEVKKKKLYDIGAWVCVSDHFDEEDILGKMLESLDRTAGGLKNIDVILQHLENGLEKKTFLLVLDDVWNAEPNKWDTFSSRLSKIVKTTGNSIIVTTRSGRVVSAIETLPVHKHEMKGLSNDECWTIIKEKVDRFAQRPIDANLEAIGQDIARKCKGLPLVANVLGGTMGRKIGVEEWSTIKNDDAWMNLEDNQKKILKISFDHLSGPLKKCFVFCSIFEKDTTMEKDELVQLWMAEGFLLPPNGSNLTMEDVGDQYFDYLLSNSLFQDIERNEIGDVESCKMHDAVHDLAVFVSGGESLIWDQTGSIDENSKIRHLRLKSKGEVLSRGVSQKLHSLFLEADCDCNLSASNIKSLRSLNLVSGWSRRCTEKHLPIPLRKLKHLRYLDISSSKIIALPKSFSKLYNLQTLKLMCCSDLEKVPDDMRNLVSLRHLYFNSKKHMPKEIGHLTSLQTLSLFVVGVEKGYRIEELECLSGLRGELEIRKLEHVGSKLEASKAKLSEKKKLQGLTLKWSGQREANVNISDGEVLEGLQPHSNLKSLVIRNYQGKNFPSWMQGIVNSSLNNLMNLELLNCNECICLPSLGLLPKLQFLKIYGMNNLKRMGSKFYVDQSNSNDGVGSATQFPALREFSVKKMKSLEERVEVEGMTLFPCLEKLNIENCSELNTWSMAGFSSNHKLSSLRITRCPKLMAIPSMDGLSSLKYLYIYIYIYQCHKLTSLPSGLGSCTSLQDMDILECHKLSSIFSINGLTSLKRLNLSGCHELTGLPIGLGSCTSLKYLSIVYCWNIISITEEIGELHSLSELTIWECGRLRSIPEEYLGRLTCLKKLSIGGFFWWEVEEFPGLTSIHQLHASLEELNLYGWDKLKSLPHKLQHLTALKTLELRNFDGLEALPEWLADLSSLRTVKIISCSNLTHLPSIEAMRRFSNLQFLHIGNCRKLKERCPKESCPEWAKISHIPKIKINEE